ncbi:cysteine hydrolase [Fictibacillus enclensis]|uniref:Isochorismatase n=1 Tax=Fictibacillus enclensis TaxID=1017270 RepID=A0A0V8JCF9_9BACL|nr:MULTISPECIES: cysteine hydrolase [Fictibacillus]KSU84683.1 isochorismatase [Fictibacillus enclensis]MDM5337626.1 cysteine hydrolase [Fictibacillus enclensis]RXY99665.1 cysteine hydrolase [Fictibacillus sp. S7]WHY73993.1 cysteine hydrolase [Fictibacillus enclensis]SCB83696.1 Nicotinamidase-related amidase [Fictibacillus enclensis]
MELRGKKHVVVVIDMLNDFIGEKAALRCENGEKIVPAIKELVDFCHEENIQVVFVQEAHRQNDRDFRVRPVHAIKGTWGSQFIPELQPDESKGDYVVQKRRHSAFSYTDFDLFCREEEIDTVVLTGVWTNVCVRSTGSDALYHGYNVICLSDSTASKDDSMHESGLRDIDLFGDIMTTKEYMEAARKKFSNNNQVV